MTTPADVTRRLLLLVCARELIANKQEVYICHAITAAACTQQASRAQGDVLNRWINILLDDNESLDFWLLNNHGIAYNLSSKCLT